MTSVTVPVNSASVVLNPLRGAEVSKALVVSDSHYEDNTILKILSCVPVVGMIVTIIAGSTLLGKQVDDPKSQRDIKIIKITNDYNICSIVREILEIAALVTLAIMGILWVPSVIAAGAVICGAIAYHSFIVNKTKQHIANLEALPINGLP